MTKTYHAWILVPYAASRRQLEESHSKHVIYKRNTCVRIIAKLNCVTYPCCDKTIEWDKSGSPIRTLLLSGHATFAVSFLCAESRSLCGDKVISTRNSIRVAGLLLKRSRKETSALSYQRQLIDSLFGHLRLESWFDPEWMISKHSALSWSSRTLQRYTAGLYIVCEQRSE